MSIPIRRSWLGSWIPIRCTKVFVPAVVTGKPLSIGGSEGRNDATATGVLFVTKRAAKHIGMPLKGARVSIQGFGNAGGIAARLFHREGCKIVAVSDSRGCIYDESGLEPAAVLRYKKERGTVVGYPLAQQLQVADVIEVPCDILIPAATEGLVTVMNADRVQARIIAEAANGPTTPSADEILHKKGCLVIPDILANAGGVTVSYFEWVQDLQNFLLGCGRDYATLGSDYDSCIRCGHEPRRSVSL